MKLSKVLYDYYVLAQNQSEIVGWSHDPYHDCIQINWNDSDGMHSHQQKFKDQEIDTSLDMIGAFNVTTCEGEVVQFIALEGVILRNLR